MRLIKKGAEAELYLDKNRLIKKRTEKKYRNKILDLKLRISRTKSEAKILEKSKEIGIAVPEIIHKGKTELELEFLNGSILKEIIENKVSLCDQIGKNIAKLHEKGIIHGDLTTSNMILKDEKVYFIDFGLGFFSDRIEDKAVDLHLLKQVLESTHPKIAEKAFSRISENYIKNYERGKEVVKRLEKIEQRGRYKK